MRRTVIVSTLALSLLLTPAVAPVAAGSAAAAESWSLDLAAVGGDDANVRGGAGGTRLGGAGSTAASAEDGTRQGALVAPPRTLAAPEDTVTAEVDAARPPGTDVVVEYRGRQADGTWSEWVPAGARLAAPTTIVQARVTLIAAPARAGATDAPPGATDPTADGTPTVRSVRLTATAAPAAAPLAVSPQAAPLAYQVYATREGLVGHTTANGHVIRPRDHFVALPSRRGLAPRGTGDYSVKVCHANGRCAWAPVWDVGPWNTRDDYWNPSSIRQNWADLPQGRPQAQAAIQNGHNGGRDQYGRVVRNAAGIDLADGTFWDGLGLTNNAWVTVTYLWTGSGNVGTVAAALLNVRSSPDTTRPAVGLAGQHARVHVECHVYGQWATGTQGRTNMWVRISAGMYVSKAHIAGPTGPRC